MEVPLVVSLVALLAAACPWLECPDDVRRAIEAFFPVASGGDND